MLAIRMQRTGRKGYPMYRVIVQESHRQPTSGRVVANLGSYNPHTKEATLNKEQAVQYLTNGAQPSDRVVKLLQAEKITLPSWVKVPALDKNKAIKNSEKLRRNQPKEEAQPEAVAPSEEAPVTPEATSEDSVEAEVSSEQTTEEK